MELHFWPLRNGREQRMAFFNGLLSVIPSATALIVGSTFTQADIDGSKFQYTYLGSGAGNNTFSFTVSDQQGGGISNATFTFNLTGNTPPTISSIPLQMAALNTSIGPVAFTVGDGETLPLDNLDATLVTTGNSALVPASSVAISNLGGGSRSAQISPTANQFGSAVVTIKVKDTGNPALFASSSFGVAINPAALSLNVNSSSASLPFTIDATQTTVTASSNNTAVISNSSVVIGGNGQSRTLTVTAGAQFGTAAITLTITGSGAPATLTLPVTVTTIKTLIVKNILDSGADSLRDCMTRGQHGDTITFDPIDPRITKVAMK